MPQVALKQATIDYRVLGPEDSPHPPVLFVHGILVDHRLWLEVAERLARLGFRCYLPNWPLGSHTIPVNDGADLSPRGVATMIHDFIADLGLSDVTLVGNDTGGGLCQILIDAYPDDVGRVVLTNCDAFDKFPPFPFTMVFAMLRGPKSVKTLFETMRVKALRHSPLGIRSAGQAGPRVDGIVVGAVPQRLPHPPRPGHAAAACRAHRSDRRGDPAPQVHETGHHGLGSARPLLHARARQAAGRAVPELDNGRGARCEDICSAGRSGCRRRRDRSAQCAATAGLTTSFPV